MQAHPALDDDDIPLLTAVVEAHEIAPAADASASTATLSGPTPASLDEVPLLTDEVEALEAPSILDAGAEEHARASKPEGQAAVTSPTDASAEAASPEAAQVEATQVEVATTESPKSGSAQIEVERGGEVDPGPGTIAPASTDVAAVSAPIADAAATAGASLVAANETSAIDVSDRELAEIEGALPADREAALARVREDTAALEADLDLQAAATQIEDAAALEVVALSNDELDTFAAWAHPIRHDDDVPSVVIPAGDELGPAPATAGTAAAMPAAASLHDMSDAAPEHAPVEAEPLALPSTDAQRSPPPTHEALPSSGGMESAATPIDPSTPQPADATAATQSSDVPGAAAAAPIVVPATAHAAATGLAHALSPEQAAHLLVLPEAALRAAAPVGSPVQTTDVHAAEPRATPAAEPRAPPAAGPATGHGPTQDETREGSRPDADRAHAVTAADAIESEEAAMAALEGGLAPEPSPATPAPGAIGATERAGAEASWAGPAGVRWDALAEDVRMQVLQRLDIFTDTGLKSQLAAHLQPIVDRASAELVETINREVGQLLRAYVAEAIAREIDKWRGGAG